MAAANMAITPSVLIPIGSPDTSRNTPRIDAMMQMTLSGVILFPKKIRSPNMPKIGTVAIMSDENDAEVKPVPRFSMVK